MLKQAETAVCPAISFPYSQVIVSIFDKNLWNLLDNINSFTLDTFI